MKIGITMDDDLVKRMDEFAGRNYMSRSGFISFCVSQYINSIQSATALTDIAFTLRRIADSGKLDDDALKKLEELEQLSRLIAGTAFDV